MFSGRSLARYLRRYPISILSAFVLAAILADILNAFLIEVQHTFHHRQAASTLADRRKAGDFQRLPDGRLLVTQEDVDSGKRHPIPQLMAEAKAKWQRRLAERSNTLEEAVHEYQERYGRRPPRGFDRWFKFAQERNACMIDDFDMLEHSLKPWRAFSPTSLQTRQRRALDTREEAWSLVIEIANSTDPLDVSHQSDAGPNRLLVNSKPSAPQPTRAQGSAMRSNRDGPQRKHLRAQWLEMATQDFIDLLEPVEMVFLIRDVPQTFLPWEEREFLESHIAQGRYVEDDNGNRLEPFTAPPSVLSPELMCPPSSPARLDPNASWSPPPQHPLPLVFPEPPPSAVASFLHSPGQHMNPCLSPHTRHQHASTSWYFPRRLEMLPAFVPGSWGNVGDPMSVQVEVGEWQKWHESTRLGRHWTNRRKKKVYWRGQTSGTFWSMHRPWHAAHRARLHLLSNWTSGSHNLLVPSPVDGTMLLSNVSYASTQGHYLDAAMTGPPVQCEVKDGSCDMMHAEFDFPPRDPPNRANDFKYLLDVDGNSWSGRFRPFMLSSALVLKTTLFREFWQTTATPWLHYVPIQLDYSDLHNVVEYFKRHDGEAREIADAGREWALQCFRFEDYQIYLFRLMLEWARLLNPDPEEADFVA